MVTRTLARLIREDRALGMSLRDIADGREVTIDVVKEALGKIVKPKGMSHAVYHEARETAFELIREGYDVDLVFANFGDCVNYEELQESRAA